MKKIAIAVVLWFAFQQNAVADMYHDYIEYRYQPELGKITILSSFVRDKKYVDYVSDNWKELAKENIFVHGGSESGEKRVFERSDTIGKYKIDTILTLYPPAGHGMGGALPTAYLQITINGNKKINCNIGYFPGGNEEVEQIMICPDDGAIFIKAFTHGDGKKIFALINDSEIITDEYISEARGTSW